jgi:transposase
MSDDFDINFERKLGSKAAEARGGVSELRRIELITGVGRRRRWSSEDKTRIVVESLADGVSVSEVARRHGLIPQQLFAWRREAGALLPDGGRAAPADGSAAHLAPRSRRRRGKPLSTAAICDDAPAFAPVVISASTRSSRSRPSQLPPIGSGTIEIAIDDAVVRVIGQAETEALVAVLRAVRRTS